MLPLDAVSEDKGKRQGKEKETEKKKSDEKKFRIYGEIAPICVIDRAEG